MTLLLILLKLAFALGVAILFATLIFLMEKEGDQ